MGAAVQPAGAAWLVGATRAGWVAELLDEARRAGGNASEGLALAERYGTRLPLPGSGTTSWRWQILAAVGGVDLTAARILEAHTDALAILAEAGEPFPGGRWGVFAAEAPDVAVAGQQTGQQDGCGWTLRGTKPWCSLGGAVDHALVTARTDAGPQLFSVALGHPSVRAEPPTGWVARGLRSVPSGPVHFDRTPARPIGPSGWYLERPGFAWGGMGVAACWYGAALAIAERLRGGRDDPDDLRALAVGTVDVALHAAALCLTDAAQAVDRGHADGAAGPVLALRVRSIIAHAVECTLAQSRHTLGPAPLAFDEHHARRVADLELYVLQHHGERDVAALGRYLAGR